MALKWGIVSAGKISHDFASALKTLPTENHQITAVAARSYASAKEFADNHSIEKAYEGYEDLAKDTNVGMLKNYLRREFNDGIHVCLKMLFILEF